MSKTLRITNFWQLLLFLTFLQVVSCGKTSFVSGANTKKEVAAATEATPTPEPVTTGDQSDVSSSPTPTPTPTADPVPVEKPKIIIDKLKDDDFKMVTGYDMQAGLRESRFWVVSKAAAVTHIYYFVLQGETLVPTAGSAQKEWSFANLAGQTGVRTYVTEKGLVFASNGGYLFWIDPASTPVGLINTAANSSTFFKFPDVSGVAGYVKPAADERLCVVSYRRGAKRFLGMGYGRGAFVEMEMASTPPYAPIFEIKRAVGLWGASAVANGALNIASTGDTWGYSCYINQNRLIYFSQYAGGPKALDLSTMAYTSPAAAATNGSFNAVSEPFAKANHKVASGGSYALSGDLKGNLFNGQGNYTNGGFYTFTHDTFSNIVFASTFRQPYTSSTPTVPGKIYAFSHDCLTTVPDCVWDASTGYLFNYGNVGIGPISALKTGGFIALTRYDANGQVLLVKPEDSNDISKGLKLTKLADIVGDPYMYTDFTGATLYNITENLTPFDFTTQKEFKPAVLVRYVAFNWQPVAGKTTVWPADLKLEARCYSGSAKDGVAFATVDNIKDAGQNTFLSVASCRDALVDHIETKITQLNSGSSAANIGTINVGFFQ